MVAYFAKMLHEIQAQIKISFYQMWPYVCLLNTGIGQNIVSITFLPIKLYSKNLGLATVKTLQHDGIIYTRLKQDFFFVRTDN